MSTQSREARTRRARIGGPGVAERGQGDTARQRRAADAQQEAQLNFSDGLAKQSDGRIAFVSDGSIRLDAQQRHTIVPYLNQERGVLSALSTTGVGSGVELDRTYTLDAKVDAADQMRLVTAGAGLGWTSGVRVLSGRAYLITAITGVSGGTHTVRIRVTEPRSTVAGAAVRTVTGGNEELTARVLVDLRDRQSGTPYIIHVTHNRTSGSGSVTRQQLTIEQVA